jgi:hypothetical protein
MHERKLIRPRVVNVSALEPLEPSLDAALFVDGLASLPGENDGDVRLAVDVQMQSLAGSGAVVQTRTDSFSKTTLLATCSLTSLID